MSSELLFYWKLNATDNFTVNVVGNESHLGERMKAALVIQDLPNMIQKFHENFNFPHELVKTSCDQLIFDFDTTVIKL